MRKWEGEMKTEWANGRQGDGATWRLGEGAIPNHFVRGRRLDENLPICQFANVLMHSLRFHKVTQSKVTKFHKVLKYTQFIHL